MKTTIRLNRIASVALAATLSTAALASCGQGEPESGNTPHTGAVEVWGTDNLVSVLQNPAYNGVRYAKDAPALSYSMAKGESEYDQIVITPDHDVSSFKLIKTDLKCGENVIDKDKIQVFVQKYIFCDDIVKWAGVMSVKDDKNPYYEYYPDMLMYMDVAERCGENTIKAGENQGVTVTVDTDTDTPAGVYTGDFTLVIDGEERSVPVSVTVWDFSLGKATGKTLFYPQQLGFMNGEFDNTDELYRTYYELCLDYDINPEYLPGFTSFKYNTDADAFIAELDKYFDHPNFTCFSLPNYELGTWGIMTEDGKNYLKKFMYAVAKASTPERCYLDKMVVNHDSLDEPQYSNSARRIKTLYSAVKQVEESVVSSLEAEGFFAGFSAEDKAHFVDRILNMPQIMTAEVDLVAEYYGDEWSADNVNAYCTTVDRNMNSSVLRDKYDEVAEAAHGEKWYYTCNQPKFPFPAHFTEATPVGNRVMRWMQFLYGYTGYLYWGIDYFGADLRNPYDDPDVLPEGNPNGDGYFFFPGRAYDSAPFPAAKLLAFRDGQEDMDMLYLFKDKYIATAEQYGYPQAEANEMFDEMFSTMADRMIDGATYNFDHSVLVSMREEIARLILAMNEGELATYSVSGEKAEATVLTVGQKIVVNGAEVSAEAAGAGKYIYKTEFDLSEGAVTLSVKTDRSDVSLFVSKTRKSAKTSAATVSLNGSSTAEFSDGAVRLHLATDALDSTFYPAFAFSAAAFGVQTVADLDNVVFDYTNDSDEDYVIYVYAAKGENTLELDAYNVRAGETKRISLALIYNNQHGFNYNRYISRTDKLLFRVMNKSGKTLEARVSGLNYTLKEDR